MGTRSSSRDRNPTVKGKEFRSSTLLKGIKQNFSLWSELRAKAAHLSDSLLSEESILDPEIDVLIALKDRYVELAKRVNVYQQEFGDQVEAEVELDRIQEGTVEIFQTVLERWPGTEVKRSQLGECLREITAVGRRIQEEAPTLVDPQVRGEYDIKEIHEEALAGENPEVIPLSDTPNQVSSYVPLLPCSSKHGSTARSRRSSGRSVRSSVSSAASSIASLRKQSRVKMAVLRESLKLSEDNLRIEKQRLETNAKLDKQKLMNDLLIAEVEAEALQSDDEELPAESGPNNVERYFASMPQRAEVQEQDIQEPPTNHASLSAEIPRVILSPPIPTNAPVDHPRISHPPVHVEEREPVNVEQAGRNPLAPEYVPKGHSAGSNLQLPSQSELSLGQDTNLVFQMADILRRPSPEPGVFSGDPLTFPEWKVSFEAMIGNRAISPLERLHYLKRYLSGSARDAIESLFLIPSEQAYQEAMRTLERRFGDPHIISNAYRDKLLAWPKIPSEDGAALRKFSDYLRQCSTAMSMLPSLNILNDDRENQRLLAKLPKWLIAHWSKIAFAHKKAQRDYPSFLVFQQFIEEEADRMCDPVTSFQAIFKAKVPLLESEAKVSSVRGARPRGDQGPKPVKAFSTQGSSSAPPNKNGDKTFNKQNCLLCQGSHHLRVCKQFSGLNEEEKKKFVMEQRLCFSCLGKNHTISNCRFKKTCEKCARSHATALHGLNFKEKGTTGPQGRESKAPEEPSKVNTSGKENGTPKVRVGRTHSDPFSGFQNGRKAGYCSMIVPVWLSHESKPEVEQLTYCMLDSQSDTSFVLQDTADRLGAAGTKTKLCLSTMYAEDKVIDTHKIHGLRVRGYSNKEQIPLPATFTRNIMPADKSQIPTPSVARRWDHLSPIAGNLHSLLEGVEVGLLVGFNCARALTPVSVISGDADSPFAVQTPLGWSIVGGVDSQSSDSSDEVGMSHRVLTYSVPSSGNATSSNIALSFRSRAKEVFTPHVQGYLLLLLGILFFITLIFTFNKNELENARVEMNSVREFLLSNDCDCDFPEFQFQPPSASHFGGCWERQIRTVRDVLAPLIQKNGHLLDDELLRTLLCEVMATVNSRPLTVENLNDPTSPRPLTPNHLLTLKSDLILPPPGSFSPADAYCRKRWRRAQHLSNLFWKRWRKEYLLSLQQRSKWQDRKDELQVGDVVLLSDDSEPRNQWPMARVTEVHPSHDETVRKVSISLGDRSRGVLCHNRPLKLLQRPSSKLVLLFRSVKPSGHD